MKSTLQIELGQRIRCLREARGFSQEAFATHANIDRAAYGKLERGDVNLTLLTLARISVSLGVELSVLFDGIQMDPAEVRATPRKTRVSR